MPNSSNIESPITLIAPGRSGTSLIANLFEHHPDCSYVGETANVIFNTWQAVEGTASVVRPLMENGQWVTDSERAARVVRQTFLTCFPDTTSLWFHKPLGIPHVMQTRYDIQDWDAGARWYWSVLQTSFPQARFFTVLRHPCDVVLSSQTYWGYSEASL